MYSNFPRIFVHNNSKFPYCNIQADFFYNVQGHKIIKAWGGTTEHWLLTTSKCRQKQSLVKFIEYSKSREHKWSLNKELYQNFLENNAELFRNNYKSF